MSIQDNICVTFNMPNHLTNNLAWNIFKNRNLFDIYSGISSNLLFHLQIGKMFVNITLKFHLFWLGGWINCHWRWRSVTHKLTLQHLFEVKTIVWWSSKIYQATSKVIMIISGSWHMLVEHTKGKHNKNEKIWQTKKMSTYNWLEI